MRETRGSVVLATAALVTASLSWAEPPRLRFYVGQDVCVECHAGGRGAQPCPLEPIPAHDRSYSALGDSRAAEIAATQKAVAEGYVSARPVHQLAQRAGVEMPISEAVYRVCYEDADVGEEAARLMSREMKDELASIFAT